MHAGPISITVLVDDEAREGLNPEHGLSLWIETGEKRHVGVRRVKRRRVGALEQKTLPGQSIDPETAVPMLIGVAVSIVSPSPKAELEPAMRPKNIVAAWIS